MSLGKNRRAACFAGVACVVAVALFCGAVLPGPAGFAPVGGAQEVPGDIPGLCPVPALEASVSAPAPVRSRTQVSMSAHSAAQGLAPSAGRLSGPDALSGLRPGHNRSLLLLKRQLLI